MCGIGFILGEYPAARPIVESCLKSLRRRGPDASSEMVVHVESGGVLHLLAAVLHLRGDKLHPQPAEDADGNVLLWNGEVFGGLEVGPSESDTRKVLEVLSGTRTHRQVVETLAQISGPFSFVFWCPRRQELYYGRDAVGRRSLVTKKPRTPQEPLVVISCLPEVPELALSSATNRATVVPNLAANGHAEAAFLPPSTGAPRTWIDNDVKELWEEVPVGGVYSLSLGSSLAKGGNLGGEWTTPSPELHLWSTSRGIGVTPAAFALGHPTILPKTSPQDVERSDQTFCGVGESVGGSKAESSATGGQPPEVPDGGSPGGCKEEGPRSSRPMISLSSSSTTLAPSFTTIGSKSDFRGCTAADVLEERRNISLSHLQDGETNGFRERLGRKTPLQDEGAGFDDDEPSGQTSRGVTERGKMSPAAMRLLARLRDSVDRRVRTIPPSETRSRAGGIRVSREGENDLSADSMPARGVSRAGEKTEADDVNLSERSVFDDGGGIHSAERSSAADKDPLDLPARVGVLFSGGLDSVVLAALLAEAGGREGKGPPVQPGEAIDLINVCFDSPTGHCSPDRLASIAAVEELRALFPTHEWRLACVDASYEDVVREGDSVWRVMQPCNTTMDFNIAAAFYFASRGRGWLYLSPPPPPQLPLASSDTLPVGPTRAHGTTAGLETSPVEASPHTEHTNAHRVENREGAERGGEKEEASKSVENKQGLEKVNRNLERLCPVGACRRLFKPGCAFGACSRCCLKAQGLLDATLSAAPAETTPSLLETCADGGDDVEEASTEKGASELRQRVCKAHAVADALRALENHLVAWFVELSTPFRAEELVSLLGRHDVSLRHRVRAGRDQHYRLSAANSLPARVVAARTDAAVRLSTKWCPAHRRSRSRGVSGNGKGHVTAEAGNGKTAEAGEEQKSQMYTSKARVLLVGIGADEFMAGYSRHRNAYRRGGPMALSAELQKDQARLWSRNLGRDDRCIAAHGREARFPFLEEEVISHIRSLPLREICNMDEPPGVGDKKVLREVADHLGLKSCRNLPKRAIQFGSRIAQHYAQRTHGSHRRGSGTDLISAFDS